MYHKKWVAGMYLLPAVLFVTIFIYLAIALNGYYSLFKWNTYSDMVFVGVNNYIRLFKDSNFWTALGNNILFAAASLFCQVGFALVLAAVLEQKWLRKVSGPIRTILFIPSMISISVVSLMWQLMLNPSMGFVNKFLKIIGLGALAIDWLGNAKTSIWCVIASSQWQYVGYTTMLFIVAIQKIPNDYYEAAQLDGANAIQQFFNITVPNVKEMISLNLITTLVGSFKAFDEVYIMTSGGPGRASEVLGSLLYKSGFKEDAMGYASAIGVVIFAITVSLSILQIRRLDIREKGGRYR